MDGTPPAAPQGPTPGQRPAFTKLRWPHLAAIAVGVVLALLVSSGGGAAAVWGKALRVFSLRRTSHSPIVLSDRDLDRQRPQRQAEILLERAVSRTAGAPGQAEAQIERPLDCCLGKLEGD